MHGLSRLEAEIYHAYSPESCTKTPTVPPPATLVVDDGRSPDPMFAFFSPRIIEPEAFFRDGLLSWFGKTSASRKYSHMNKIKVLDTKHYIYQRFLGNRMVKVRELSEQCGVDEEQLMRNSKIAGNFDDRQYFAGPGGFCQIISLCFVSTFIANVDEFVQIVWRDGTDAKDRMKDKLVKLIKMTIARTLARINLMPFEGKGKYSQSIRLLMRLAFTNVIGTYPQYDALARQDINEPKYKAKSQLFTQISLKFGKLQSSQILKDYYSYLQNEQVIRRIALTPDLEHPDKLKEVQYAMIPGALATQGHRASFVMGYISEILPDNQTPKSYFMWSIFDNNGEVEGCVSQDMQQCVKHLLEDSSEVVSDYND